VDQHHRRIGRSDRGHPLSHALVQHELLDELRLWIHPLLVGKGGPADLLYRDTELRTFELVDATR
jgi:riboflavin biosynthesis pyrimidine reductase